MKEQKILITNPPYFSNWVDQWMPKLANKFIPFAASIKWLTPNMISTASFIMYTIGSLFIFITTPYHYVISLVLLPLSYVFDCMDGQLARTTRRFSPIGDYLDKTLDVLKIFIITSSLSLAAWNSTENVLYVFLGFIACFFFCYRYYIKHEIMYSQYSKDYEYLNKSRERLLELYVSIGEKYNKLARSFVGKIKVFWLTQRTIFYVDEGEFIFFTCVGLLINSVEFTLWVLAISQAVWGIWRLYQRASQLLHSPEDFINPIKR